MKLLLSLLQEAAAAAAPAAQAAPASAPAQAPPQGGIMGMMVPLLLMFVVMYFLMIRPQRKQQQEKERLLANIKKNDHVLTNAGIYGIVKQVKTDEQEVTLCIDEKKDVCIKVTKASIATLVKASSSSEADALPAEAKKT